MAISITGLDTSLKTQAVSTQEVLTKTLMVDYNEWAPWATQIDSGLLDKQPILKPALGEVAQPGMTADFSPKGTMSWTNRFLQRRNIKLDQKITEPEIQALYASYMGMVKGGSFDVTTFPFEAFILDRHLKQAARDTNKALATGSYNSSGTNAADCLTGIKTQIAADIAASPAVIAAGNVVGHSSVISDTNAVDIYHSLADKVSTVEGGTGVEWLFFSDPACQRSYQKGYRTEYNIQQGINKERILQVDGDAMHTIVPIEGLRGTGMVFVTHKENLFYLYDDRAFNIDVQKQPRYLALTMDWAAAIQYGDPAQVFATKYTGS